MKESLSQEIFSILASYIEEEQAIQLSSEIMLLINRRTKYAVRLGILFGIAITVIILKWAAS